MFPAADAALAGLYRRNTGSDRRDYLRSFGYEGSADRDDWTLGVTASLPLFTGGSLRAESRQARAELRQREFSRDSIRDAVVAQTQSALYAAESSYASIALSRQAAEMAEKHTLLELCKTPELACEVTVQPIERLGVDAAILFSDILIPLEAMGLPLAFTEEGPKVRPVRSGDEIAAHDVGGGEAHGLDALDAVEQADGRAPVFLPFLDKILVELRKGLAHEDDRAR